jgi:hypothetical protein
VVATGFESDEWDLLLLAPWTVAMGIVHADMSDSAGRRRELDALMERLRMTQAGDEPSRLVRSIAIELVGGRAVSLRHGVVADEGPDDLRERVLDRCRAVADILDIRAGRSEADAFKQWLMSLAETVAEAAREGGVLGIGGARVSERERSMLGSLARALRLETEAPRPPSTGGR